LAALSIPVLGLAAMLGLPAVAQAQDCDRACLRDIMTQYLESLVANDPSLAPLADNVRMTEDTIETPIGEGLWATATGIGEYRNDFRGPRDYRDRDDGRTRRRRSDAVQPRQPAGRVEGLHDTAAARPADVA
jgi:hypothetical protein